MIKNLIRPKVINFSFRYRDHDIHLVNIIKYIDISVRHRKREILIWNSVMSNERDDELSNRKFDL